MKNFLLNFIKEKLLNSDTKKSLNLNACENLLLNTECLPSAKPGVFKKVSEMINPNKNSLYQAVFNDELEIDFQVINSLK